MLPNPQMVQKRYHPSNDPPSWMRAGAGWETDAGVDVTPDNAMMVMAFLACVRIISDTIASLPLITYRRLTRGKERATDHYLYGVLHDEANPEMSAFTFRRLLLTHESTRGNGLAEIEFDNAGRVRALWPLNPDKVEAMGRDPQSKKLFYVYRLPGSVGGHSVKLSTDRIFHIKWLSNNGLWALSPVQLARNAVALSVATEKNGSMLFSNGSEPGIMLKTPNSLSDKAYDRLQSDWEVRHQGLDKKHRLAILEEGLDIAKLTVDPDDAQFLQTRVHQVSEFGRLFGISDDMLNQQGASATYASVEQFGLRFTTFTIRPWTVGWEQESNRTLLTPTERRSYFSEHLVDGLLRGDTVARMQSQSQGFMVGKYSVNDMLEMDNQNPIDDPLGDMHFVPMNMMPLEQAGQPFGTRKSLLFGEQRNLNILSNARATDADVEQRSNRSAASRRRMMLSQRKVFRDTAARVLRRELRDVMDAAKKAIGKRDAQSLSLWLDQYYQKHETFVHRQFSPVMSAYADMVAGVAGDEVDAKEGQFNAQVDNFTRAYINAYAARHVGISRENVWKRIQEALEEEDPISALDESFDHYEDVRSDEIARLESTRENNAAARMIYVAAGFIKIRWRSFNASCPYCTNLDGAVVGVEQTFLSSGEDYQPEGAESPLRPSSDIGHPPAHDGCDCMITAWR